jgi:BASS family bile acid:Na+ symporter
VVVGSGLRVAFAVAVVTVLALAAGHALGGPEPGTRTAVAVCSAARNPGLALLVATFNDAPPTVVATVLTYLVVSALTAIGYVAWRRRALAGAVVTGP